LDLLTNTREGQGPKLSENEKTANAELALARTRVTLNEAQTSLLATKDGVPQVAFELHARLIASINNAISAMDTQVASPVDSVEVTYNTFAAEFDFGAYPDSAEVTELMNGPDSGCKH
jgi:hypothetical protein